jgi:hypothetical protein
VLGWQNLSGRYQGLISVDNRYMVVMINIQLGKEKIYVEVVLL